MNSLDVLKSVFTDNEAPDTLPTEATNLFVGLSAFMMFVTAIVWIAFGKTGLQAWAVCMGIVVLVFLIWGSILMGAWMSNSAAAISAKAVTRHDAIDAMGDVQKQGSIDRVIPALAQLMGHTQRSAIDAAKLNQSRTGHAFWADDSAPSAMPQQPLANQEVSHDQ